MDRDSSKRGNIVGGLRGKAGLGTSGPDSSVVPLRQKEAVFSSYLEILLIFLFSHEIEVLIGSRLLHLSSLKT